MNRYIREQIVLGESENVDEKHIVLCGDKGYIKYCGVTLTSVLLSNPEENFVFHIFCDDVSQTDKERLEETASKFKTQINIYYINEDISNELVCCLNENSHINVAAFFRILAFDVLSEYLKSVLYLDSDILIIKKIDEFWNIKLNDKFAIVIHDVIAERVAKDLHIKKYFNSGVMYVDLIKWRQEACTDKCIDFILEKKPLQLDQDALNVILDKKTFFVDEKYNYLLDLEKVIDENTKPSVSKLMTDNKDVRIVHFVGRNKPWCHWVQCIPIVKKYIEVQKESMWSDNKIITVDDVSDKKYRYKHIRKEMVVAFKERQFKNTIYWGVRYVVNKTKYLLDF